MNAGRVLFKEGDTDKRTVWLVAGMVEVRVRVDDPLHRQIVVAHDLEDALMLAARIDDDRLLGVGAREHRAVALARADGKCLEEQHQGLVAWKDPASTVTRV